MVVGAKLRELLGKSAEPASEATIRSVLATMVPELAEWCIVDLRATGAGVLVAHELAKREEVLVRALAALDRSEHLLDVSREALAERRSILTRAGAPLAGAETNASILAVPLVSRDRVLGVVTFGRSRREIEPSDLEVAEDAAARIAMAVDLGGEAEALLRAHEARDAMLSVLAHDLRTPLSTLSMVTTRLKKNRAVLDATTSETHVLARSVARIESMLKNLVDCSRLTSGRLRLQPERVDLAPVVAAAIEAARPMAGKRVLDFDQGEGTFEVNGDRARLRQVIDQLLSNGIKFTPETGAVLARIDRVGGEIVVSVSDSGIGIPADQLESVFIPSWAIAREKRTSGTADAGAVRVGTSAQGPRMGLYVSRGLIEAHGGRLWVESVPDQGTTFSFSLPRADLESTPEVPRAVPAPTAPAR